MASAAAGTTSSHLIKAKLSQLDASPKRVYAS